MTSLFDLLPDIQTESDSTVPATPASPQELFDPKLWYYDPVSRCGLPYDGIRTCSCGCQRFIFITRGISSRDHHIYCEHCYTDPRYRLSRPYDLVYATLDAQTKSVTPTRPLAEVVELRKRIKAK